MTITAICHKCGATVEVNDRGYFKSHNEPANDDGYIGRCGNRYVRSPRSPVSDKVKS